MEICETPEGQDLDPEILHQCIESVPEDADLESRIKNMCVKSGTVYLNCLIFFSLLLWSFYFVETCLPGSPLNTVDVKGESFLGMESEGAFEQALFDQTIHSSICKDEEQVKK